MDKTEFYIMKRVEHIESLISGTTENIDYLNYLKGEKDGLLYALSTYVDLRDHVLK